MGYYPMLIEEARGTVQGLLITLRRERYNQIVDRIDTLEGYDPSRPEANAYRRLQRPVRLENGQMEQAWVYAGRSIYVNEANLIHSGDWLRYLTAETKDIDAWWRDVKTVSGLSESQK
jgi:gamma-glutamylcyclotransferase (GGCT)/AIG2-like uncharacterized protein YtfP